MSNNPREVSGFEKALQSLFFWKQEEEEERERFRSGRDAVSVRDMIGTDTDTTEITPHIRTKRDAAQINLRDNTTVAPSDIRSPRDSLDQILPGELNIWQSWPRDWEDMGKLERVFSVLNRGQHVTANVTWALLQGESEVAKAAWDGLTGQERGDYIDILRHYDIGWAPVLGTVLNIGLDPTTYLTGPLTIFKRAATKVGSTKAASQAIDFLQDQNIVTQMNKAFNIFAEAPKPLVVEKLFKTYQMTAEQTRLHREVNELFLNTTDRTKKVVHEAIRTGTQPIDPTDFGLYTDAMNIMADFTQRAIDLKLITPEAAQNLDYLPVLAKGWLKHWERGQDVLGPARFPGFARPKETKLLTEHLQKFSESYKRLGELDSITEIKAKAAEMVQDPGTVLGPEFKKVVDSIALSKYGKAGNIKKVKRELFRTGEYWAPVDDITESLTLYGQNIVRAENMRRFRRFALESDEAQNWARPWVGGIAAKDEHVLIDQAQAREVLNRFKNVFDTESVHKGVTKKEFNQLVNWFGGDDALAVTDLSLKRGPVAVFDNMSRISDDLASRIKKLDPNLKVFGVDAEVSNYLTKVADLFGNKTKETHELLRMFDKTTGIWKRMATIWRAPFHVRNAVGNTFRAYMAGVSPFDMPRLSKIAADIQTAGIPIKDSTPESVRKLIREARSKKITMGGMTKTGQDWIDTWSEHGVRGWGWTAEMSSPQEPRMFAKMMEGKSGTPGPAREVWELSKNIPKNVGLAIEDNARIMVAMDRLAKNAKTLGEGVSESVRLRDAAQQSWKYLFQYDQLTEWEKVGAKRLFPFYTWMRKNVPLQVESLITDPGRYSKMSKAYNMFRHADPVTREEHELLPDYMADLGHFRIPEEALEWFSSLSGIKQPDNLFVHVDLPWADLAGTMEPVKTMLNSLSPAFLPIQLGLNAKAFPEPGAKIERFRGDLRPAPWPVTWLPEGVWPLLGVQPMKDRRTGEQILGMPAKSEHALSNAIPIISEITRMYPQTARLEKEDAPWRKLRYITALQLTPVDMREQHMYHKLEQQRKEADATRLMNLLGRRLTREELQELLD